MKSSYSIAVVLFALALSACATPGMSFESFEASLRPVPADHGRVFIYRLEGDGERVSTSVYSNGEAIGRAVPGSFFYKDLPIGPYILAGTKNTDRTLTLHVAEGGTQFVRVDIVLRAMRYDWDLTLVSEDIARTELARTTNTGK